MNDACWNLTGVAGDKSCSKLEAAVHCRNCDVYAGAAQRSLQRPVDAGYRAEWAARLRQPVAAPDVTGRTSAPSIFMRKTFGACRATSSAPM